jgi:hypothetical protein
MLQSSEGDEGVVQKLGELASSSAREKACLLEDI